MNDYPIHWCVLENDTDGLKHNLSKTSKSEIEKQDLRGKTPLELAIFLNKIECAKILVEHGADCGVITKTGWNLVQESVSTGNANLVKLIISYRDFQRESARSNGIPELLKKLKQAPDFYVEMKWEFTSWIPLISKACPSDVYKIYKSGSNVRIDTTLIGFNGTSWERGNRSYIFQADNKGAATIIEIDHILKTYHMDKLTASDPTESSSDTDMIFEPDESVIQTKLTSPNIVTFLDIEKIEFERNRSGLWGWRSDKNEIINNYDCKVFTANNLQLVTKTRVEHLNKERANAFLHELEESDQMSQNKDVNGNIPSFLRNFFQGNEQNFKIEKSNKSLTSLEYFQKQIGMDYFLNGTVRSIECTQKSQTFNANLSLSDSYPLSLHEQVLPIVDLMALNNSHFKKLKEFITLQLPSGFPVKIEIPLYRVITAKVTFGNINALDQYVENVTTIKQDNINKKKELDSENSEQIGSLNLSDCEETDSDTNFLIRNSVSPKDSEFKKEPIGLVLSTCVVDECVFKIPDGYRCTNRNYSDIQDALFPDRNSRQVSAASSYFPRYTQGQSQVDEDDILLQLAIQQSLSMNNDSMYNSEMSGAENLLASNDDSNKYLNIYSNSIMPVRDSSGSTKSFEEYQERRNTLNFNQNDDDIILQRVLAESLMNNNSATNSNAQSETQIESASNNFAASSYVESGDPIMKALEWSRREAEERNFREKREQDDLEKILALSLVDK